MLYDGQLSCFSLPYTIHFVISYDQDYWVIKELDSTKSPDKLLEPLCCLQSTLATQILHWRMETAVAWQNVAAAHDAPPTKYGIMLTNLLRRS